MTFEERKRLAAEQLIDFLDRFAPPRGLDEDAQAKRIEAISESFARNMPAGDDYADKLATVFSRVEDTHDGHSWPTQARFVSSMPRGEEQVKSKAAETYRPDDRSVWLRERMSSGQAVPEPALWGAGSANLGSELEQYRTASVRAWKKAYGENAFSMMRSKYGAEVELYFTGSK